VKKYIILYDTGNVYKYEIDTDNLPDWITREVPSQLLTSEEK
jgi:hypothetical protein